MSFAARGWRDERRYVLELADEDGNVGQGEAAPLDGYSPDTLEQAIAALAPLVSAPVTLSELRLDGLPPSARCAVETAMVDLAGHRQGKPAAAIVGNAAPAAVALSVLLPEGNLTDTLAAARKAVAFGARTLKVKVGRPSRFGRELELLQELRRAFGSTVELRLDANQGFAPEVVRQRLAALAVFEPLFVEEPVARGRWDLLEGSPVALAADESLHAGPSRALAWAAIRAKQVSVAVLKVTTLGGPLTCASLGRKAAAEGASLTVGHAFEGPTALAAAASLALALAGEGLPLLACGLEPVATRGRLEPWNTPGLGLARLALP